MKSIVGLLTLASVATAMPSDEKSSKSFSLFSVVTFPNDECTTTMDSSMNGICKTQEECTENGGSVSGNCASGFGVCCFHSVDDCSTDITNNITYVQNDGYPTAYTTASKTCGYDITGTSNVCQIRLDFDTAVLAGPDTDGDCGTANDELTITSPSTTIPGVANLCGTLTGQHLYFETEMSTSAGSLKIVTGTDSTTSRTWKIKVSLIECDNPMKPPEGCLQWHTGASGKLKSFNGGHSGTQQMIKNQNYDICIRTEEGYCKFQVSQATSGTSPDSFALGAEATAAVGTDCNQAYITIEDTAGTAGLQRFCGNVLSDTNDDTTAGAVTSNSIPFRVGVLSDNTGNAASDGFDLIYRQVPC